MTGSPIDVAINLLWCRPGKVGGSEDYLVRQLLGLAEIESVIVPTLYVLPGFAAAHPDLAGVFRLVEAPISGRNRLRRIRTEQRWLARQTKASKLVHHGGGTLPTRGGRPTVLTIHDLQYLRYPQYFGRFKRSYLRRVMPRSARSADIIAVPSHFVRESVMDAFGIDAERIVVVPHGLEPTMGAAATDESSLREQYQLGAGPVVVLPAMTHPHKGHVFLLRVLAEHWTDPDLRLVLIGGQGAAEDTVQRAIAELGVADRVVRAGRVTQADRDGLLRMATAMVFPSEYEGFGAPIIEAMALGAPVICSDRTSLPEVAGDAAIIRPLETGEWADALDQAIARRDVLVRAGRARAGQYTAVRSAEAVLEAYGLALS